MKIELTIIGFVKTGVQKATRHWTMSDAEDLEEGKLRKKRFLSTLISTI